MDSEYTSKLLGKVSKQRGRYTSKCPSHKLKLYPQNCILPLYEFTVPKEDFIDACHNHWNVKCNAEEEVDPATCHQCPIAERYNEERYKDFKVGDNVILDLWNVWRQRTHPGSKKFLDSSVEAGVVYKITEDSDWNGYFGISVRGKGIVRIDRSCIEISSPTERK